MFINKIVNKVKEVLNSLINNVSIDEFIDNNFNDSWYDSEIDNYKFSIHIEYEDGLYTITIYDIIGENINVSNYATIFNGSKMWLITFLHT